jgi:DNA-binding NarL/FixJ family response regulator
MQYISSSKGTKEPEKTPLTHTEQEILKSIALGKSVKEIAVERFSSVHTIMTHKKNIFRKLEVNNVHEATKYALRSGLIDTMEYYI